LQNGGGPLQSTSSKSSLQPRSHLVVCLQPRSHLVVCLQPRSHLVKPYDPFGQPDLKCYACTPAFTGHRTGLQALLLPLVGLPHFVSLSPPLAFYILSFAGRRVGPRARRRGQHALLTSRRCAGTAPPPGLHQQPAQRIGAGHQRRPRPDRCAGAWAMAWLQVGTVAGRVPALAHAVDTACQTDVCHGPGCMCHQDHGPESHMDQTGCARAWTKVNAPGRRLSFTDQAGCAISTMDQGHGPKWMGQVDVCHSQTRLDVPSAPWTRVMDLSGWARQTPVIHRPGWMCHQHHGPGSWT